MTAASVSEQVMRRELQRIAEAIERYTQKIESIDGQLTAINEANANDETNRQIKEYESAMAKQSNGQIVAEDAMDNIVRLQNQLKIARRRNQLLARENSIQKKNLIDRTRMLKQKSDELDTICDVTGWSTDAEAIDFDAVNERKASTHDMIVREQEVRQDIKSLRVIVKKKEDAVLALSDQIESQKERRALLNQLNNDIRVHQRDTIEMEERLKRMNLEGAGIDRALVEVRDRDDGVLTSVAAIETDKEYLCEAVAEARVNCRRQENVIKAQMARQQQLEKRLQTVMQSLREMKLEKEFERNVSKAALVPSASRDEPEDVSQILPEDECIPIDTYHLLYKNNEMKRTNVARKNMLVLEKESVIQAIDAKLRYYIDRHNMSASEDNSLRRSKDSQVNGLMGELRRTYRQYSAQIEALEAENKELQDALDVKMGVSRRGSVRSSRRDSATSRRDSAGSH